MSFVSFSSLRPGDIVRFSNPTHSGTAEDFTPDGEELSENENYTYAVSVKARVSSVYRSHNFGFVVEAVLVEGEFIPDGYEPGTPYPFYENDDWETQVLSTPDTVLLAGHYSWQDDNGVWVVALQVSVGVWSFDGSLIEAQELKNVMQGKKVISLSRVRK